MKGEMILFTGEMPGMLSPKARDKYSLSSDKISLVRRNYNTIIWLEDEKPYQNLFSCLLKVISDARMEDAGEYTCRIMIRSTDEINVTHTLVVNQSRTKVITV